MSKLTDFKLLSFDAYGTLIDWERGALTALEPMLSKSSQPNLDPKHILQTLHAIEPPIEKEHPDWKYSQVLTAVHPKLCAELNLPAPTSQESEAFGASVGSWPLFPDTLEALTRLSKRYKLVILSNVDNTSFASSFLSPFPFDAVLTAQDIGSYKPDLKNFEYLLRQVRERFDLGKHQVLHTAQSQFHDHHSAREMGLKTSWIYRPGAVMGNREDPVWDWKFDTLGDMADAVDKEVEEGK
ncbi:hypothetical protein EKO04_010194 [Ascochyta lentis]|uniref:Haloacid dehalogenase n=1 Tax=Ascochyta lentis TaxID=205686 RepID=A0A8H7IUN0_9PLEO|nr:hypothetical protein EKO04_010194 [Ascochyta lentis]